MKSAHLVALRRTLMAAASTASIVFAGSAHAQVASVAPGLDPEGTLDVVPHHLVPQGPGSPGTGASYGNSPAVLDTGVNGVGQQIAFNQVSPTGASLGLCTGTLINPRTVITAAHCVYAKPAHMYGSQTGTGGGVNGNFGANGALVTSQGTPISFGFNSTNRCLGVTTNGCAVGQGAYEAWRNSGFQTQTALNIYNGNQVWYLPNSLTEFANGDIALVTLDTHAKGIPTWTLLFSPLDAPAHATITGYGGTGVGTSPIGSLAGIDYRRRSAENMVDALMSWNDQNTTPAISGPTSTARIAHQHAIYWTDFDDPTWDPNKLPANFFTNTAKPCAPGTSASPTNGYCGRNNGYYDFNALGGPSGTALPNEGVTAGGDSGGPLVIDQRWDRKVIAGVLTGSISYNGGISTYGSMSVYPPLFQFWEDIVQNNPYVYASAKAGDGDWSDASHWVQDMDPNYVVIGPDGQLVNAVPDTNQGGPDGATVKFGTVCFVNQSCSDVTGPGNPVGNGTPVITAGGPGSTNFVPDNVEPVNSADAGLHKKARYYDVTLRETGTTTLGQAVTIDKLTINGASKLDIQSGGNLKVLSDFNQIAGWTNVNGVLNTGEAMIATGYLTGTGTFKAPYLTVVGGTVAPGGADSIGTLTVDGNLILASASALYVDAGRAGSDKLAVTGVLSLSDGTNPGGALVMNKAAGAAPRHGQSFTIAQAGTVQGTFGSVYSFQGVLRPELTYTTTEVIANLRAGSLVEILDGGNATEVAFANALDQLRSSSYNSLYGLYGSIDLMDGATLARTLGGLAPTRIAGEALSLQDKQSKVMLGTVSNRLSDLGTRGTGGTMSIIGAPESVAALLGSENGLSSSLGRFGSTGNLLPSQRSVAQLPKNMSAFISGGISNSGSSYGDNSVELAGQRSWHIGMGLEMALNDRFTLGTAFGYADGYATPGGEGARTDSRASQAAVYGSYQFGDGIYVAGLAAVERFRTGIERQAFTGDAAFELTGATQSTRYSAMAEAGVNLAIGRSLTLTPRASLGYASYQLGGFRENGGEVALQLDDLRLQRIEAKFGAKFAGSASLGRGWSFVPQLQADWVQNLSGTNTGMKVRFANAPDVGFALPLAGGDSGWAEVKGGLKVTNGVFGFGAGVESSLGRSDFQDNRAVADFTFRF